jgi:tetratricopeptide (TPR) repeat protein
MARITLICALLATLSSLAGCDVFTSPGERVARAERLIEQGSYSEALVELNVALEKIPNDARAELALAHASLQLGSADAATHALDVAEKSGADKSKVADLRARVMLQEGKFDALLAATDAATSSIAAPQRELLRLRALIALNRFDEAIELARRLRAEEATAAAASVGLAECYARLGNAEGALSILDAAVQAHPQAAEAWLARGRLLQLAGRPADAEQSWRAASSNAGGQLTLMQQLNAAAARGDLQLARNDLADARATHDEMLRLAPDGALAALLGARLMLADGKASEAVAALQDLIARHAGFDEVRIALASAQLTAGNHEQALQQTEELAQRNPSANNLKVAANILREMHGVKKEGVDYWLDAAGVQVALGQPFMARVALKKAVELAPDSALPITALAQLELRAGNPGESQRISTSMAAKQPHDANALALLAEAYRAQRQYPQAAATLERLWGLTPSAATALALARVRQEGKLGNAADALKAWVAIHPEDFKLHGAYADALRQAGQNREAIVEYEALVAAMPDSVPALNNLAWLYYLEKDAKAVPMARRAWQLAPRVPSVADTYGWLLVESGAVQEGLNVLEGAYHDGGIADPQMRYHYAAALAKSGQGAKAAPQLAALLAEVPDFPERPAAQELAGSLK